MHCSTRPAAAAPARAGACPSHPFSTPGVAIWRTHPGKLPAAAAGAKARRRRARGVGPAPPTQLTTSQRTAHTRNGRLAMKSSCSAKPTPGLSRWAGRRGVPGAAPEAAAGRAPRASPPSRAPVLTGPLLDRPRCCGGPSQGCFWSRTSALSGRCQRWGAQGGMPDPCKCLGALPGRGRQSRQASFPHLGRSGHATPRNRMRARATAGGGNRKGQPHGGRQQRGRRAAGPRLRPHRAPPGFCGRLNSVVKPEPVN